MRHFVSTLGFSLIAACFISCENNNSESNSSKLAVAINLKDSKNNRLSVAFESISYSILNAPDSSPLVEPYLMKFDRESMYIQDFYTGHIHKFDKNGKPQFVYQATGSGPGEFRQSDYFFLEDSAITILDRALGKAVTYGPFQYLIDEEKINKNIPMFEKRGNRMLYFMNNMRDGTDFNFLLYENEQVIEEWERIRPGFEKAQYGDNNGFNQDFDGGLVFPIPYSTEVLFFDSLLYLTQKVTFNIGDALVDKKDFVRLNNISRDAYQQFIREKELVEGISLFTKLGPYYFLSLQQYNQGVHLVFMNKDFEVIFQSKGLENDLDQMLIRGIPWTYDEDKLIFLINSVYFYNDYIKTFSGKKVIVKPDNVHDFFEKNQNLLKEDRYVLISLKVKNQIEK